jgi:hypothetical protein
MLEDMEALSDAEKGRLFTACLIYSKTGEAPILVGNERFVFPAFMSRIDKDRSGRTYGPAHWNWRGGVTPENQKGRNSIEYRKWRNAVFSRDNYTCLYCGERGGRLNAHHKKPWSTFKALRYDISNGITLCEKCHRAEHRRGQ